MSNAAPNFRVRSLPRQESNPATRTGRARSAEIRRHAIGMSGVVSMRNRTFKIFVGVTAFTWPAFVFRPAP